MTDPFMALRAPVLPIDPEPAFAAQLRARVAHALELPKGVTVSDLTMEPAHPADPATEPDRDRDRVQPGDVAYVSLWVPDVERAAAFFGAVLGWSYRPGGTREGRQIDGVQPSHGMHGGHDQANLFLCFMVDDLDAALERVRDAGGTTGPPTEERHGRIANCVDDQASAFALFQPPAGDPGARLTDNGAHPGDLGYITIEVLDSARSRTFYRAVLGWQFAPGRVDDGWSVQGVVPMTGMHGGHLRATTVPMYRVEDIGIAVSRIRAAGGRAPEPERQSYGLSAECLDDQGTRFYIWQP